MSVVFLPVPESTEIPEAVLDESVVRAVLWFFGRHGAVQPSGFRSHLLETFAKADSSNFERLYAAFPVEGFWMHTFKNRPNGVTLAVRALDLLGVKA